MLESRRVVHFPSIAIGFFLGAACATLLGLGGSLGNASLWHSASGLVPASQATPCDQPAQAQTQFPAVSQVLSEPPQPGAPETAFGPPAAQTNLRAQDSTSPSLASPSLPPLVQLENPATSGQQQPIPIPQPQNVAASTPAISVLQAASPPDPAPPPAPAPVPAPAPAPPSPAPAPPSAAVQLPAAPPPVVLPPAPPPAPPAPPSAAVQVPPAAPPVAPPPAPPPVAPPPAAPPVAPPPATPPVALPPAAPPAVVLEDPSQFKDDRTFCQAVIKKYGCSPGSFGWLPESLLPTFKAKKCIQYYVAGPPPKPPPSSAVPETLRASSATQAGAKQPIRTPELESPADVQQCKGGEEGAARARCEVATLNKAWYRATDTLKQFCVGVQATDRKAWPSWETAGCACLFEASWNAQRCTDLASPFRDPTASAEGIHSAALAWTKANPPLRVSAKKPVVATLVSVVSSKVEKWGHVSEAPLFRIALSKILQALEQPYEYWFLVGFDAGDAFFDNAKTQQALRETFENRIGAPARKAGVDVVLRILRFTNPMKKPGPMFNFLSETAMLAGADFMYRINDDSQIATKFASSLIRCLARMDPPFFGICGPTHDGGGQHILTHDFVHRTHLMVFPTHYPAVFGDWYLDDWISIVYTPSNTAKIEDVKVVHKTTKTRYSISRENNKFLPKELMIGASFMETFRIVWRSLYQYDPKSDSRPLKLASGEDYTVELKGKRVNKPYSPNLMMVPKANNAREWLQKFAQRVQQRKASGGGGRRRLFRRLLRRLRRRR